MGEPSDKELLQIAVDTRLYRFQATAGDPVQYELTEAQIVAFARAVLARWGAATPVADGEAAELVEAMRELAYDVSLYTSDPLTRAADLLERLALRPIPVSERLPGPGDCDDQGSCWWFSWLDMPRWRLTGPMEDSEENMHMLAACFSHWLPAHALPLPEVEHG